jgi:hypothetical protein
VPEKTYKNISNAPVLGNAPGKVFKADLENDQRKRMIDRGSIIEVDPKSITEATPEESVETPEEVQVTPHDDATGSGDGKNKSAGPPESTPPASPASSLPGGSKPPAGKKG